MNSSAVIFEKQRNAKKKDAFAPFEPFCSLKIWFGAKCWVYNLALHVEVWGEVVYSYINFVFNWRCFLISGTKYFKQFILGPSRMKRDAHLSQILGGVDIHLKLLRGRSRLQSWQKCVVELQISLQSSKLTLNNLIKNFTQFCWNTSRKYQLRKIRSQPTHNNFFTSSEIAWSLSNAIKPLIV